MILQICLKHGADQHVDVNYVNMCKLILYSYCTYVQSPGIFMSKNKLVVLILHFSTFEYIIYFLAVGRAILEFSCNILFVCFFFLFRHCRKIRV